MLSIESIERLQLATQRAMIHVKAQRRCEVDGCRRQAVTIHQDVSYGLAMAICAVCDARLHPTPGQAGKRPRLDGQRP